MCGSPLPVPAPKPHQQNAANTGGYQAAAQTGKRGQRHEGYGFNEAQVADHGANQRDQGGAYVQISIDVDDANNQAYSYACESMLRHLRVRYVIYIQFTFCIQVT